MSCFIITTPDEVRQIARFSQEEFDQVQALLPFKGGSLSLDEIPEGWALRDRIPVDGLLHRVADSHPFITTLPSSDNFQYHVRNNHPQPPSIDPWTPPEIAAYEAGLGEETIEE